MTTEQRTPLGAGDDGRLLTPLFALVTASALFYFLAVGALLPTLPTYVESELDGDGIAVGLVVGAFAVTAALIRPTVGRLGDRWGRRVLTVGGAAVAAVSFAPLGLVDAVWFLIVLRLVAGIGEASFFIGAATAAQDLAPDTRRGEAASFFSVAIYGGLAFGPLLGEWVYDEFGSTATWLTTAASCGVSALIGLAIPGELGRNHEPSPDRRLLHGAALLPGSVLLLGLIGFSGYAAFLPLYIDDIGVEDAGPFFLVYGVIVLAVRILGARLPDRLGPVRTSSMALVAIGGGTATIAVLDSRAGTWAGTALLAVGMSLLFPALMTVAMRGAPASERAHAMGTFGLFFDLAQGLGAPTLGLFVALAGTERAAFVGGAVAAGVGLVVVNTALRRATEGYPSRPTETGTTPFVR